MRLAMWKTLLLGLSFAFVVTAASAQQPQCNERDRVLKLLAKKYKPAFPK